MCIRDSYMPYAMSVIVSRALPEIDGFKPAHRKLLYTCLLYTSLTAPIAELPSTIYSSRRDASLVRQSTNCLLYTSIW